VGVFGGLVLVHLALSAVATLVFGCLAALAELGDRGLSRGPQRQMVASAALIAVCLLAIPVVVLAAGWVTSWW
jgi:hypothetical protein